MLFSREDDPIIDPTAQESVLMNGYIIVGANHRDEICLIFQSGNLSMKPEIVWHHILGNEYIILTFRV